MVNIDHLIKQLHSTYFISLSDRWLKLAGGYECDVWRVGEHVVRICPSWRSEAEIRWTHDFVRRCAEHVPQTIAPIQTKLGDDFIVHEGRIVLVFPFVEGQKLDRMNRDLILESAEILARIHLSSANLPKDSLRPSSKATQPPGVPKQADPNSIQDPNLDTWYNEFVQHDDLQMGMMHGDYYRGNILCTDGKIVGVIDWDECNYGAVIREVAWSTWEMCHTDAGDELDTIKATQFLNAYLEINSQLLSEMKAVIPLIRYHLRYEIRRSIAMEEVGLDWDDDYRQSEIRAFNNLRNTTL